MRRKVSTLLDETLYRRAKLESVIRGKQISEIIGEALELYLDERGKADPGASVATDTWAALRLSASEVEKILADEDWLEA